MNHQFQHVTDAEAQLCSEGFLALKGPSSPIHSTSSHSPYSVPSVASSLPPPSPIPSSSSHELLARMCHLEKMAAIDRDRIIQLEKNSASDMVRIGQLEEEVASQRILNEKILARLAIYEEKELANSVLSLSKAEKKGTEEKGALAEEVIHNLDALVNTLSVLEEEGERTEEEKVTEEKKGAEEKGALADEATDKLDALTNTLSQLKEVVTPVTSIAKRVKSRIGRRHKVHFTPYVNKEAMPKPLEVDDYPMKERPALLIHHFVGRSQVDDSTISLLKGYFDQFKAGGDDVFFFGDNNFGASTIFRSSVDEILMEGELSDLHVDAFAALLFQRLKLEPSPTVVPSLYVSASLHILMSSENVLVPSLTKHITKKSVEAAEYLLVPVVYAGHWILGVGLLKRKIWHLYDSLKQGDHVPHLRTAIQNIRLSCPGAFGPRTDISRWKIVKVNSLPKQDNNVDCGTFVCRYIEKLVCHKVVDWKKEGDWNLDSHAFRIQLALDFFGQHNVKTEAPIGI